MAYIDFLSDLHQGKNFLKSILSYLHGVLHFLHTSVRGWAEATTVGDKVVDLATPPTTTTVTAAVCTSINVAWRERNNNNSIKRPDARCSSNRDLCQQVN